MKLNARRAYNKLRAIGAPVFAEYDSGEALESGHFAILAELAGRDDYLYPGSKNIHPDGYDWAEYYSEDYREEYSRFGVHLDIHKILDEHGLYCEWYDCGSLRVYDA